MISWCRRGLYWLMGEVITASESENPEVFWAIRGAGGGNFGIHTQFVSEMFPVTTVSWFNIRWKENLERVFDVFSRCGISGTSRIWGEI